MTTNYTPRRKREEMWVLGVIQRYNLERFQNSCRTPGKELRNFISDYNRRSRNGDADA